MVGVGLGLDGGIARRGAVVEAAGIDELGHQGGLGGGDAGAGGGEASEGGGLDVDPARPGLVGEGEVAGIGRAGLEDDHRPRLGRVEGGLEVATGGGGGRGAGGGGGGVIRGRTREVGRGAVLRGGGG